jgi:hypothetical protein
VSTIVSGPFSVEHLDHHLHPRNPPAFDEDEDLHCLQPRPAVGHVQQGQLAF